MYERFVRWAFTRFYREFAWTYDVVAAVVSLGHWLEWICAALPYVHGSVLELGCGTGRLQCALADHASVSACVGFDISRQMLALTQRRLRRARQTGILVRGNAQALPFVTASFDTVIATFPSEYIIAPATLSEARRVLHPKGRIVIVWGAEFTDDGLYQRVVDLAYRFTLQRSPRPALPLTRQSSDQSLPSPAMPPYRLEHALEEAGFHTRTLQTPTPGSMVYLLIGEAMA